MPYLKGEEGENCYRIERGGGDNRQQRNYKTVYKQCHFYPSIEVSLRNFGNPEYVLLIFCTTHYCESRANAVGGQINPTFDTVPDV